MREKTYSFPPRSFTELRQLPILISRGDVQLPMGKRSYRALCNMLDDPESVAMNNISTLAKALGISPPTLTRISKMLGYSGFPTFQNTFRHHLNEPQRFYSSQAKRSASRKQSSSKEVLQSLAGEAIGNIEKALQHTELEKLETAVDWLATGVRLHLFGYRQSSAIASMMTYSLSMIRDNVQQLGMNGHGLSTGLSQVERNSVVVLFSSAPYSKDALAVARIARRQQARVIAITDSHLSPLTQWSNIALMSPTQSQFYSNSFSGMIFLIETLLTLTARTLGTKAIASLESREELIREINDEY